MKKKYRYNEKKYQADREKALAEINKLFDILESSVDKIKLKDIDNQFNKLADETVGIIENDINNIVNSFTNDEKNRMKTILLKTLP